MKPIDWFAGCALMGLLAGDAPGENNRLFKTEAECLHEEMAETAYRLALAMMKERGRGGYLEEEGGA